MLLAVVFVVAGVAKLADRAGSRKAVADFGVPSSLATPLATLLPLAELAVAAALIPAASAWWGALGALALLLLFVAGISINLARGRKPDCHCFGQLHSAPAGWRTLARNGALAAIAGFVLWEGRESVGPSAVGWLGALSAAQLAALIGGLVLVGLLGAHWWFLLHLLRQNGRLIVRLEAVEATLADGGSVLGPSQNGTPFNQEAEGLPVGSEAPQFSLSGLYGESLTLGALRSSGKPVMLLFTDPNCGPCTVMLPKVGRWQEEHQEKLTIALVSRGGPQENRTKAQEHGVGNVLLQEDWEISEAYRVVGTPSAVLITPEGKVASPVFGGEQDIEALLAHAVVDRAHLPVELPVAQPQAQGEPCPNCGKVHANGHTQQERPAGPKVGEPAPEVALPDLEGQSVELEDFRGEETMVLFWNPGCGFCQQMLPDLKAWEEDPPAGAPKLLLISAGTEEANREQGLTSTMVLDQQFTAGRAFGASGTPSAVLVDAEGRIASEVALGAPAVLGLAVASRAES